MVLKSDLMLFASVIEVSDICIELRQAREVIVCQKPLLRYTSDFDRLVVPSHHVQRRDVSQTGAGRLLAGSAILE